MTIGSGLYVGELSEARAGAAWRRRRAALRLIDLEQAPARLGLTPRDRIEAELAHAGLGFGGGIQALCAGGLTAYLCHDRTGRLTAVRIEIRAGANARTWLLPAAEGMLRLRAKGQDLAYTVRVRCTAETAQIAVDAADDQGAFVTSVSFIGRRAASVLGRLTARVTRLRALAQALAAPLDAWSADARLEERQLAA